MEEELGKGAYGTVKRLRQLEPEKLLMVKEMVHATRPVVEQVRRECAVLEKVPPVSPLLHHWRRLLHCKRVFARESMF